MAKFRKKQVVVDAIRWRPKEMLLRDVIDFFGGLNSVAAESIRRENGNLIIKTLEGDMIVRDGDWIIKGIKGELYPCKPDIFAETYEPVGDKRMIPGLGKDAPTITNEHGGKQSLLPYRFDLMDPHALFALAKVLHMGAEKYGEDNWRNITVREHLNHLLAHVFAYMAGDESDDHLEHAFCRAMMAVALHLEERSHEQ